MKWSSVALLQSKIYKCPVAETSEGYVLNLFILSKTQSSQLVQKSPTRKWKMGIYSKYQILFLIKYKGCYWSHWLWWNWSRDEFSPKGQFLLEKDVWKYWHLSQEISTANWCVRTCVPSAFGKGWGSNLQDFSFSSVWRQEQPIKDSKKWSRFCDLLFSSNPEILDVRQQSWLSVYFNP